VINAQYWGGIPIRQLPELLAPAGSPEAVVAAVENGADAVYLGGAKFNARQYAANFTGDQLLGVVAYTHRHNVKTYVTVNTLLKTEELPEALEFLAWLKAVKVDAVIIQDVGLLNAVHQHLPDLSLHASTQMAVHNAAGVRFFAARGISRVVLARELSLEDIAEIYRSTGAELEVFIHGALCVSYSGQCLMSSMIGGRSGNRGRCAQPCRLPYTLINGQGREEGGVRHLLSPRDLMTIELLPELVNAGVKSLKIEGRMKRAEYVATVTRVYRKALDRLAANPNDYRVTEEEIGELAQIFNRDFTTGYLEGRQGAQMMSYQRPNNRGVFLGRVKAIERSGKLKVQLETDLSLGDGLEFWVTKGGRQGLTVNLILLDGREVVAARAGQTVELPLLPGVEAGDRIFKTSDAGLLARAALKEDPGQALKVPLAISVVGRQGKPLAAHARDALGNEATAVTASLAQAALKHPLGQDILEQQLGRLGNTPYRLENVKTEIEGEIMVPVSELNALRRDLVAGLEVKPAALNLVPFAATGRRPVKPLLAVEVSQVDGVRRAFRQGADLVYFAAFYRGRDLGTRSLKEALDLGNKAQKAVIPVLPRLFTPAEEDAQRRRILQFAELGARGLLAGNPGSIQLVQEIAPQLKIYGDYPLNTFNPWSAEFFQAAGLDRLTLSPELNFEELAEAARRITSPLECLVHGRLPLMLSQYCAVGALKGGAGPGTTCSKPCLKEEYGLKDKKQLIFPLGHDLNCRMYVYNSKELCLLEDLPRFRELGIATVRLHLVRESAARVGELTGLYRQQLDYPARERQCPGPKQEFTKGHYYRGVE